jgi:hypothetical protein
LDPIGGHLLLNLHTAAAAAATVVGLARLVREWGHANGDLVALAVFASPMTIIASTSLADFIWALVFFVWGALFHLRGRSPEADRQGGRGPSGPATKEPRAGSTLIAGVLFALSIGCRLSSGFLLLAFLVADGWDPANRKRCLRTGLLAGPLGALLFVPSWLAFDRTLQFLENQEGYRSFGNNIGRFLYKNYAGSGLALLAVVALTVPALLAALPRWRSEPLLRFAVLGFVGSEALYFVMPWKLAHLLPALVTLFLWIAVTRRNTRPFLWLLIAATALNGVVTLRLLAPDDQDEASTGSWDPALSLGLLVNDIRCRADFMDETPEDYEDPAWSCTLEPMRGSTD